MAKRKKWIQKAIKRPGALRRTAKRLGIIKGDEKLTEAKLAKLAAHARKTGNKTLLRRVALARTLKRMGRRRKRGR